MGSCGGGPAFTPKNFEKLGSPKGAPDPRLKRASTATSFLPNEDFQTRPIRRDLDVRDARNAWLKNELESAQGE